jgi:hypothetical protein
VGCCGWARRVACTPLRGRSEARRPTDSRIGKLLEQGGKDADWPLRPRAGSALLRLPLAWRKDAFLLHTLPCPAFDTPLSVVLPCVRPTRR